MDLQAGLSGTLSMKGVQRREKLQADLAVRSGNFLTTDSAFMDSHNIELFEGHGDPCQQEARSKGKGFGCEGGDGWRRTDRLSEEKAQVSKAPEGGARDLFMTERDHCMPGEFHGSRLNSSPRTVRIQKKGENYDRSRFPPVSSFTGLPEGSGGLNRRAAWRDLSPGVLGTIMPWLRPKSC